MKSCVWARLAPLALLVSGAAMANDPFELDLTFIVPGNNQVFHLTYSDVQGATDAMNRESLSALNGDYNDQTGIDGFLDFRGLNFDLAFAGVDGIAPTKCNTSNTTDLCVSIPALHFQQVFSGTTASGSPSRDRAMAAFIDWLKSDNNAGEVFAQLAAQSPIDPVAGNQTSLINSAVDSTGDETMFTSVDNEAGGNESTDNYWGTSLDYTSYDTPNGTVKRVRIPITYTVKLDNAPGQEVIIQAPVSRTEINSGTAYTVPLTMIYRYPINDHWVILPSLTWGVTYSDDLGGGGTVAGATISSSYTWHMGSQSLTMGNMVGHLKTLSTTVGDFTIDPNIHETVYKNGFLWSVPNILFGKYLMEFFWVNTQMKGSDLYIDNYDIVGFTIGKDRSEVGRKNRWAYGAKWFLSPKDSNVSFNVSYWF